MTVTSMQWSHQTPLALDCSAPNTRSTGHDQPSHLKALPLEIRLEIMSYLLVPPDNILNAIPKGFRGLHVLRHKPDDIHAPDDFLDRMYITYKPSDHNGESFIQHLINLSPPPAHLGIDYLHKCAARNLPIDAAILRVCRQFCAEGTSLLRRAITETTFEFDDSLKGLAVLGMRPGKSLWLDSLLPHLRTVSLVLPFNVARLHWTEQPDRPNYWMRFNWIPVPILNCFGFGRDLFRQWLAFRLSWTSLAGSNAVCPLQVKISFERFPFDVIDEVEWPRFHAHVLAFARALYCDSMALTPQDSIVIGGFTDFLEERLEQLQKPFDASDPTSSLILGLEQDWYFRTAALYQFGGSLDSTEWATIVRSQDWDDHWFQNLRLISSARRPLPSTRFGRWLLGLGNGERA